MSTQLKPESKERGNTYTVKRDGHTHAGKALKKGDTLTLDNPATVAKLKALEVI